MYICHWSSNIYEPLLTLVNQHPSPPVNTTCFILEGPNELCLLWYVEERIEGTGALISITTLAMVVKLRNYLDCYITSIWKIGLTALDDQTGAHSRILSTQCFLRALYCLHSIPPRSVWSFFQSCLFSICFYVEFLTFSLQRKGVEESTFHLNMQEFENNFSWDKGLILSKAIVRGEWRDMNSYGNKPKLCSPLLQHTSITEIIYLFCLCASSLSVMSSISSKVVLLQ